MDSFIAFPTSTTYTPLSPVSVIVDEIITPVIPTIPILTTYQTTTPFYYPTTSYYTHNNLYYYDSGIGENPLVQHETNEDLRYKFLDKWLHEEYSDILRRLKVDGKHVKVLSLEKAKTNDISKDSESDYEAKADFIGYEILTLSKNKKILDTLVRKTNIKYYDLPHNNYHVRKAQAKYVRTKLDELSK